MSRSPTPRAPSLQTIKQSKVLPLLVEKLTTLSLGLLLHLVISQPMMRIITTTSTHSKGMVPNEIRANKANSPPPPPSPPPSSESVSMVIEKSGSYVNVPVKEGNCRANPNRPSNAILTGTTRVVPTVATRRNRMEVVTNEEESTKT